MDSVMLWVISVIAVLPRNTLKTRKVLMDRRDLTSIPDHSEKFALPRNLVLRSAWE